MFYALCRTISNYSASNFHAFVSKVIVISKKSNFCIVASPSCCFIAYSTSGHFFLNKRKIYRSYYVNFEWVVGIFHLRRGDSTRPKPNHNLGHEDALDLSVSDKNVTSLLEASLNTTAQKRIFHVIPSTLSMSYYELIFISILNRSKTRHILAVVKFLCTVYICQTKIHIPWGRNEAWRRFSGRWGLWRGTRPVSSQYTDIDDVYTQHTLRTE